MYGGPYAYPPQYYPPPRRKKSGGCAASCCRCLCCFCCFFVILFFISILSTLFFYHAYDPRLPSYRLDTINVTSFDIKSSSTLSTAIHAAFTAQNPNKHLEFVYGSHNTISVEYSDVSICTGKLPGFRQGRENTTSLQVDLKGEAKFGQEVLNNFTRDQKSGRVPLMVRLKMPINVILGEMTMREFRVSVNCSMVVNGLSPGKATQIISKETVFGADIGSA